MSSFSALFSSVPGGCWITLFSLGTAHLPTQPASSEPPRAAFRYSDRLTTRLRPPPRPAPLRRSARLPTALDPPAERPHTLSRPTAPQHPGLPPPPGAAPQLWDEQARAVRRKQEAQRGGAEQPCFYRSTRPRAGLTGCPGAARLGSARLGTARHGTARHGTARHGTARHGTARHGLRGARTPGAPPGAAGRRDGVQPGGGSGPGTELPARSCGAAPGKERCGPEWWQT
ncbi:translation initiation factor IF-2-like [Corvus cornix cornix]|uniref:translation initiation factor IF-2-like n=1 Tax=Corvus cornix cornix TaxID=932674 RepID=UPI0019504488|nr:translation initiation factor IF-2-like [Corvus cornix cornix]